MLIIVVEGLSPIGILSAQSFHLFFLSGAMIRTRLWLLLHPSLAFSPSMPPQLGRN